LDCRNGLSRQIPFDDPSVVLLVADTQVSHSLADGAYGQRRRQCASAANKLRVPALRDATVEQVAAAGADGTLSAEELLRARHVVTEIARTLAAVQALEADDLAALGRLMVASHASLRDDFQVSCPELDTIVETACSCDGVCGARMTGGGFGGSAIVLAQADRAEAVAEAIRKGFAARFGRACPVFATQAAAGAGLMS
jgi:galactokinase